MQKLMDPNLITYSGIRCAVLEAYFEGCRHMGLTGRPHLEAIGYAEYQFENAFNHELADLMKDTVLLVLTGPWYAEIFENIRRGVRERLLDPAVTSQLAALPAEDREAMSIDLAACGVTLQRS